MPTKVLEKYAKESGKTIKEVEVAWEKAKEIMNNIWKSVLDFFNKHCILDQYYQLINSL